MRWLPFLASLALACALSPGEASPAGAQQTSSASPSATAPASTAAKPAVHKKKHHSKREPAQKAPTADRISEIQSALSRGGYYQGNPNGKWDSSTIAALQKFQSANGIEANGKLDAPTLQKLGLGSDIAGVSAPKQVVPPSSAAPSSSPAATSPSSQTSAPAAASTTTASNQPSSQN